MQKKSWECPCPVISYMARRKVTMFVLGIRGDMSQRITKAPAAASPTPPVHPEPLHGTEWQTFMNRYDINTTLHQTLYIYYIMYILIYTIYYIIIVDFVGICIASLYEGNIVSSSHSQGLRIHALFDLVKAPCVSSGNICCNHWFLFDDGWTLPATTMASCFFTKTMKKCVYIYMYIYIYYICYILYIYMYTKLYIIAATFLKTFMA